MTLLQTLIIAINLLVAAAIATAILAGHFRSRAVAPRELDELYRALTTIQEQIRMGNNNQQDLANAVTGLTESVNKAFDDLHTELGVETITITTALEEARNKGNVDPALIQTILDATANITAKSAQAKTDIAAMIPADTPVAPTLQLVGPSTGNVGDSVNLTATASDGAAVQFSSSDATIASVDATSGLVDLEAAGTAVITATSATGATASLSITVS